MHDHAGKVIPAPMDLIIRCEGFEQKFGGLRYAVRRSRVVNGDGYETVRVWEYDHLGLQTAAWQDLERGGWYFEWTGERVSKPCRDLIHTDGSVGTDVNGGSPYRTVAPSIPHLIESHALTDAVATWKPWPVDCLAASAIGRFEDLLDVPEASWDASRWRLSDFVAVMTYDGWDNKDPRRRTLVWSREDVGHRQVQALLDG